MTAMTPMFDLSQLPPEELAASERLAMLPSRKREKILAEYTDDQLAGLMWDWQFWARPDQLPPTDPWSIWAILGAGRGAGKTRTGSEWIREKVKTMDPRQEGVFIGATPADVRDLMIDGPSGIRKITPPSEQPAYEPSLRLLTFPNGVRFHARSGADPESVRGLNLEVAWVDELVKFKYPRATWDNLRFAMREGERPQTIITTTPKRQPLLREILARTIPGTVIAPEVSTYRNMANLATSFLEEMRATYEGTTLGLQELWGRFLEDVEGALWSRDMIEVDRWKGAWLTTDEGSFAPDLPEFRRVLVGVDPSGSTGTECGIVAVGITYDQHAYVLADYSVRGTPNERGRAVIRCAHDNDADLIVGEKDYGGDMMNEIVSRIPADEVYPAGSTFRYEDVRARDKGSKKIRAEVIVNLYQQHRVHHVGTHADLEDEMTTWVPDQGKSPNRVDALVWAIAKGLTKHVHRPARTGARDILAGRVG